MERKKFIKLSLYSFGLSLIVFVLTYFCFHFLTDSGFSLTWHEEPGKPFVTNMMGVFAVLLAFLGATSLLVMHIFCGKDKK